MSRRFCAYIIDIIVVLIICSLLNMIIPIKEVSSLNHELNNYSEQVLNHEIGIREYISNYIRVSYDIDRLNIVCNALSIMILIIYFMIIPILNGGKTLGLKLLKLKISGDISFNNLFKRNIITIGILYLILNVILIHVLNYKYYFICISILSFIQFILVIVSTFMIIYRKDKKGLQDLISNTYIEKVI
jgi:uncharacterized RDD family membrane protein YckC